MISCESAKNCATVATSVIATANDFTGDGEPLDFFHANA